MVSMAFVAPTQWQAGTDLLPFGDDLSQAGRVDLTPPQDTDQPAAAVTESESTANHEARDVALATLALIWSPDSNPIRAAEGDEEEFDEEADEEDDEEDDFDEEEDFEEDYGETDDENIEIDDDVEDLEEYEDEEEIFDDEDEEDDENGDFNRYEYDDEEEFYDDEED